MAETDRPENDSLPSAEDVAVEENTDQEESEEKVSLGLEVKIDARSACERHVTVSIPREDIERYFDKEFSELMTSAQVPGFRPGRAPRKLIETRFRKDVADRVKSSLLMDSIGQISDSEKLSPISEPDFDFEAVQLPDEGPMTFEFDLEVRPEFEVPQWRGLKIERPVREFSEADVDQEFEQVLARYGQLAPKDGPASPGDYIVTNLSFVHSGQTLSSAEEEVIRIRSSLSFRDGTIEGFDKLMEGAKAGDKVSAEATLTDDAPNRALRGEAVTAEFEILEVKRLELPELTPAFLAKIGDFESEADLRDAVRDNLKRQLEYQQHRRAREQVTAALTVAADWDLPPGLLERQSEREMNRAVMELQRSGFGEDEIRSYENQLRQNSRVETARALKEHFILERIAEDQDIDADEADYDAEIALIAMQSGETPRRVRSRLEKSGTMDALRNQIIERKVIDLILAEATFTEVPYELGHPDSTAINRAAGGGEEESEIPEARAESEPEEAKEES
ncbi:MAG: trigger factor [Planctomycetaceae bacterium]|nr:trigger factor [Planctomycetaceae bacterium]